MSLLVLPAGTDFVVVMLLVAVDNRECQAPCSAVGVDTPNSTQSVMVADNAASSHLVGTGNISILGDAAGGASCRLKYLVLESKQNFTEIVKADIY